MLPSRNFDYYMNARVDYRTLMAQLSTAQKISWTIARARSVTYFAVVWGQATEATVWLNSYVSVITATRGIIFKICFMFQNDTFDFINTCILTEQVVKQDHMLIAFWFCWYVHVCLDGYLTKP